MGEKERKLAEKHNAAYRRKQFLKASGRFLVNWFLILTMPMWGGFLIQFAGFLEAINGGYAVRKTMRGGQWLWE